MTQKRPDAKTILFIQVFVLSLCCLAVYSNALFDGFVFDDHYQVLRNFLVKDFSHIPEMFTKGVWSFDGQVQGNYYRPLMQFIYMINYHLFGFEAWGFHLVNILFHAGSSILVFMIVSRLLGGSPFNLSVPPSTKRVAKEIFSPPFMAALLFAVHPIHTEAVTWVAGLPDVSFAFFLLMSFYWYIRTGDRDAYSAYFYAGSLAAFAIAALCKETALVLPVLLVLYDFSFGERTTGPGKKVLLYLPYAAVVALYLLARYAALGGIAPVRQHAELTASELIINIFPLFRDYLEKLFFPANLNVSYVLHPVHSILNGDALAGVAVTLLFALCLWLGWKKSRAVFLGLTLIAIPLLPVLYIPGVGKNTFAERYLYLPSVGLSLLVALLAAFTVKRPKGTLIVAVIVPLVIGLFSLGTIERNAVWRNDETLWSDSLAKAPDNPKGHNQLGLVCMDKGQTDKAVEHFLKAAGLEPSYASAFANLGLAYMNAGRMDQAIDAYKEAIRLDPSNYEAKSNLGLAYSRQGLTDMAVKEYKDALSINPNVGAIHFNLGRAFRQKGMIDEAIGQFEAAASLDPQQAEVFNSLGIAYAAKGLLDKAAGNFARALKLAPDNSAYRNNLEKARELQGRAGGPQ